MTDTADIDIETDPRRAAIRAAAFEAFSRYGFRRTSMEDIAGAAGVSRAALYLHYRNKQDIFRSIVQAYFTLTETRLRAVLNSGSAPGKVLSDAFAAKLGPELAALFESPHGDELLDAHSAIAADIITAGEARIAALLADWLRRADAAVAITLAPFDHDAAGLANTMVAALGGLKQPGIRYEALCAGMARLAQVFARGLRP